MNYEYLKVFYLVCEYHNFSKAAKELYTSQPAISRIISSLEAELSTKLFLRTKSGVMLTKEGERLYQMIEIPFNQLSRIEKDIQNFSKAVDADIYIGATLTSLECYVFDLVKSLQGQFPNIHYQIYTGSTTKILDMVDKGKIDFAFVTTPFKIEQDLELYQIKKIEDVIIAGNNYKNKINSPLSIKDLINYPLILLSKDNQFRVHIDSFAAKYNIIFHPEYETDSVGVITPMVEKNYGLAFIPKEMALEAIKDEKCFIIDLLEKAPKRNITLVTRTHSTKSNIFSMVKDTIINKK